MHKPDLSHFRDLQKNKAYPKFSLGNMFTQNVDINALMNSPRSVLKGASKMFQCTDSEYAISPTGKS